MEKQELQKKKRFNLITKFRNDWKLLNKSIYVGDRLNDNLKALLAVSVFTAFLGLVLMGLNFISWQMRTFIPSAATFLGGVSCAYFSGVRKKREIAIIIPTVFCAIAFTYYTLTGAADGTAILWSMLMPIGISFFVSVKYGVYLSVYYMVFFCLIFYTPLKAHVADYYNETFMVRFPLFFGSIAAFTLIAMSRYHRGVLLEIEYTDRLSEEVKAQTKMATERAEKLERLSDEMVETLALTIDAKDRYTNGHSFRVSGYSVALAKKLGWSDEEINELEREALLHDIGKIGVPDAVLNKPGRLTDEEYAIIKSHASIGGNILSRAEDLQEAAQVARHHHERYDGTGYPDRLKGDAIPLHARVVAIADAFDAMNSDRIYRKSLDHEIIRLELLKGRGVQFDPEFLDVFYDMFVHDELDKYVPMGQNLTEGLGFLEEQVS